MDEDNLATFSKEIEIMSGLRHPNVVLFLGACLQPGKFMIVTELLPHGDLSSYIMDTTIVVSLFKR
jgi:serine/threonine protein kinase